MEPQALSPQELQVADQTYRRIGLPSDLIKGEAHPDTTAIILNWSRFPNVKRIASLLCSPILDSVIAEVFIWNNSPNKITHDDFRDVGCPPAKLRLYNSPENLYFQARFMACELVETPYCFIQDDDYLVLPEVIHALHAAITQSHGPRTIHLLPAHEHLSTSLREVHVANAPDAALTAVHTGFAWLGHGAMLHRSEAVDFLKLMRVLQTSDTETKMADNYYTILRNCVPEVWFDQGIELGGGQPFTVGTEGEERNNRHIVRAADYLTAIAAGEFGSSRGGGALPETRCLLETNIALLPVGLQRDCASARDILNIEALNRGVLGVTGTEHYLEHPPSRAVDDRLETYFLGLRSAKSGDFISLDFFDDINAYATTGRWRTVEMVWVVDLDTEHILQTCVAECSLDGVAWVPLEYKVAGREVATGGAQHVSRGGSDLLPSLRECILRFTRVGGEEGAPATAGDGGRRYFRIRSVRDSASPWRVHQVYLRGQLQ